MDKMDKPDLSFIHGKRLAIMIVKKDASADDEGDVYFGTAQWDGENLELYRSKDLSPIRIPQNALNKIQKVSEDTRFLLEDAEYCILLTGGKNPEGLDPTSGLEFD